MRVYFGKEACLIVIGDVLNEPVDVFFGPDYCLGFVDFAIDVTLTVDNELVVLISYTADRNGTNGFIGQLVIDLHKIFV